MYSFIKGKDVLNMKNISINKTLKLKNKSIEIRYEGIPLTEDIDTSKQEKLLEIFLLKHCRNDMVKNVSFLRTILDFLRN